MPFAITPNEIPIFSGPPQYGQIVHPLRRMFVLFVAVPCVAVAIAYAFAQLVLVPQIVLGTTADMDPQVETVHFLALLKQDHSAYALGSVTQPYLRVPGILIGIDNDNIQVYEYVSEAAARSQAKVMFEKEKTLSRREFFHAYVKGPLLILYLGVDAGVLGDLQQLLGDPLTKSNRL
jgi:hypothetical protein